MKNVTTNMLNVANAFLIAANRCGEKRTIRDAQYESPVVPFIVNCAFSIELYMKALLVVEGIKGKNEHSLEKIFDKIPEYIQREICDEMGIDIAIFKCKLSKIKNAFIDWRYIYEKDFAEIDVNFLIKCAQCTQAIATKHCAPNPPAMPEA